MNTSELINISNKIKLEVLELAVLKGKGHLGGTYSCLDLLVALYYGDVLNINANNFEGNQRDRFILSKGHACLALYVILEDLGIITKDALNSYGENGGLGAQLDISVPGVDWNTGSLGHALGVVSGIAMASKMNNKSFHAYTILGDAEMAEGSVWEALRFIKESNLPNIEIYVNVNGYAAYDKVDVKYLVDRLKVFLPSINIGYTSVNQYPFLRGLNAHYHVMSEKDYKSTL